MNIFKQQSPGDEAGFYSFYHCVEALFVYLLFTVSLALSLTWLGAAQGAVFLLLPLALSFAVLGALRFRIRGVILTSLITVSMSSVFAVFELGAYGTGVIQNPFWFTFGLILLFSVLTGVVAVVTGYHLQSVSISNHRQNMLRKIFDSLPVGIWVRARSGETVYLNDRWASFSPKTKHELLDTNSGGSPVEFDILCEREAFEMLEAEDESTRYKAVNLIDSKGRRISCNLLTLRIFIDQLNDFGTLSLLVDETASRIYQDKIRMSENSLRMALNNAEMGFWDQNLETGEIHFDENWLKLLDLDVDDTRNPLDLWKGRIHPEDTERVHEVYREYFQQHADSVRIDYRMQKGDGEYIWVQDYVGAVERRQDGSLKRIMGTMQDITARKQYEIDLEHAKERAEMASEAKGQFIATISHEIRTPLNAIIGLSSFLAESELLEDQLDLAQTIHNSGNSLLMLVNDVLDFSKIESGRLELEVQEFPLRLCFEECVKLFKMRAAEKDLILSLSFDPSLPEFAVGDMERLKQIVHNLLSNALKFTDSGHVEISVAEVAREELSPQNRPDPARKVGFLDGAFSYLRVNVTDTGVGIPETRQHVLFQAFTQADASTTRKYGGTGLGLAICKRLVDAMGGNIWVDSCEGRGSQFSFVIRTQFAAEDPTYAGVTHSPFYKVERIAFEYPCDILIVGPKEETKHLIHSCRELGYAPHQSIDYNLNSRAFIRRHYGMIFIWLGDEERALTLSRGLSSNIGIKKTASIIGYASEGRAVSIERCRLSGLQDVVNAPIRPKVLSRLILSKLGVRG
ncbi:MAG TPA: hypothetical protein DCX06_05005 [Opitutae bacterium]|nr:hypothetical protein [Opitutae bacterium]